MHFHHLHFYVEDVAFWRRWFVEKLAFYSSTEAAGSLAVRPDHHTAIDVRANVHREPEVLRQGNIEIRLSGSDRAEAAAYLRRHPSGLADVALASDCFDLAVARAASQGAKLTQAIHLNAQGRRQCQFQGWADLRHTLVEVTDGDKAIAQLPELPPMDTFLQEIDHVVINVQQGELAVAADWYQRAFDLSFGQRFEINTLRSGLRSQVLVDRSGSLQLPLNEPSSANSQVQEFLQHNRGAGVQHVALRSTSAVRAIAHFRAQGLDLIDVPDTYYEQLPLRLDCPMKNLAAVSQQRLLVDWAAGGQQGMLLQTFTKPLFAEPTFFFEIIERGGYLKNGKPEVAKGFGQGNFQALFEAIERSQLVRELAQESSDEPQHGEGDAGRE
ncbi:MAG: VOC family protein [Phormidesmis sp.]